MAGHGRAGVFLDALSAGDAAGDAVRLPGAGAGRGGGGARVLVSPPLAGGAALSERRERVPDGMAVHGQRAAVRAAAGGRGPLPLRDRSDEPAAGGVAALSGAAGGGDRQRDLDDAGSALPEHGRAGGADQPRGRADDGGAEPGG